MYFTVQQAVRMYNRLMKPVWEGHELSVQADTAFDAGEWSAGFISERLEEQEDHVFVLVCDRTGITRARMVEEMYRQEQEHYLLCERGPTHH